MTELTGRRRYLHVMPWHMNLPNTVMALQVERSEFNCATNSWENKWHWATPEDVDVETE